jgi:multidrug efflux pump subunit AcrA (membrane-fusion protein)
MNSLPPPAKLGPPSESGPPADSLRAVPLFRRVAIDAAVGTQIGEALAAYWRGVRFFTWVAFALTAGIVVFLASVEYAPSLRVYAYTDARSGLVRLKAPIDGRITAIGVKEGQSVHEGETIAVISRDRVQANGASQHAEIRGPKILFLDEATSHLDIDSETQVNQAITEMNITRVLIAHRKDTIASADRVVRLDPESGLLVETPVNALGRRQA